ncbi:hypothetical protein OAS39_01275 [Pirellulales bacterium]|nr:hypothetical protein [Pirellulales bacterium]
MRRSTITCLTIAASLVAAIAPCKVWGGGQDLARVPLERSSISAGRAVDAWEVMAIATDVEVESRAENLPMPVDELQLPGAHADASQGKDDHHDVYHTTGAPMPGDGAYFFQFPKDPPSQAEELINVIPGILTHPNKLGNLWAEVFCAERDELHTELDDEAIGIQFIAPRPPLVVEWNEPFLGPGTLASGIEFGPLGPVFRPALWVWGEYRTAVQYYDDGASDANFEWANRLDLFTQVNLSGTERIFFGVRPTDRENSAGTRRDFVGYDFRDGDGLGGGNFQPQTAFFEGDFGEIFPMLDPYDSKFLDVGFSVGRMPLLAQQGLLVNEDRLDAITVTRNTINNGRNLNLRMTGVFAWGEVNRNSAMAPHPGVRVDNNSQMFALLTETDFFRSTVNADAVYVTGDDVHGDLAAIGISSIRRHYFHHNTYNTSLNFLASFPTDKTTDYAGQGELLFSQVSWTPHHYLDLIYLNTFLAIDQFTSPARGPLAAGPLGQTGIAFAGAGIGRAGPPMPVRTNDTVGTLLGYQWFFDETRKQLIWEIGGAKEYEGTANSGVIGTILRYQAASGQHTIFVLDGFVAKREGLQASAGGRAELRFKF